MFIYVCTIGDDYYLELPFGEYFISTTVSFNYFDSYYNTFYYYSIGPRSVDLKWGLVGPFGYDSGLVGPFFCQL